MKIFTYADARIEKQRMFDLLCAKNEKKRKTKFVVVDKNGASAINPVSAARAEKYVAELDVLCPSYAPHAVRPFA